MVASRMDERKDFYRRHCFRPGYPGSDHHYRYFRRLFIAGLLGFSGSNGFHIHPFFDRLKSSPLFLKATRGILTSFVGLLLYVLIKFIIAVPWDIPWVLLGVVALIALLKKIDLLYIVIIGAIISIWLFS